MITTRSPYHEVLYHHTRRDHPPDRHRSRTGGGFPVTMDLSGLYRQAHQKRTRDPPGTHHSAPNDHHHRSDRGDRPPEQVRISRTDDPGSPGRAGIPPGRDSQVAAGKRHTHHPTITTPPSRDPHPDKTGHISRSGVVTGC